MQLLPEYVDRETSFPLSLKSDSCLRASISQEIK